MDDNRSRTTMEITTTVNAIMPMLKGRSETVQGLILADLVAYFLAGHFVEGDADATRKVRAETLAEICQAARAFTMVDARLLDIPDGGETQ